jgi:hypothetical protein
LRLSKKVRPHPSGHGANRNGSGRIRLHWLALAASRLGHKERVPRSGGSHADNDAVRNKVMGRQPQRVAAGRPGEVTPCPKVQCDWPAHDVTSFSALLRAFLSVLHAGSNKFESARFIG